MTVAKLLSLKDKYSCLLGVIILLCNSVCSVLHAHAQFCRFDKAEATAKVQ